MDLVLIKIINCQLNWTYHQQLQNYVAVNNKIEASKADFGSFLSVWDQYLKHTITIKQ